MNGIKTIETSEVIFTDDNSSLNTSAGIVSAQANSTTALNGKINSVGFNTITGVLTLTKEDGNTLTKDLDGRYLESVAIDDIPNLPASKITTGTLGNDRIPDLNADKITAGTLADARIPNLNASKINAGTLADARIPDLNASKITAGTLADARIPNLPASKITSGTLAIARIPTSLPYVSTSGNETIAGVKTFSSVPICSTQPTSNNQLVNKQYVDNLINSIATFNPASSYTFSGNNTFTGSNLFNNTQTKIRGQVVQIKEFHSRQASLSNSNGHTGTTGENYTLLGASPVDFKCSITPSNTNCYIRVSVVAHYSVSQFLNQGSWWSGVRLYRTKGDGSSSGLTELKHANNTRGGNANTAQSISNCWITETAGASNLGGNTWNTNFIRQVSGIYIDKDVKVGLGGVVEYSIAVRGNTFQTNPNSNQMAVAFNQGYQGIGSGRPASTSYIQLEEIYNPP